MLLLLTALFGIFLIICFFRDEATGVCTTLLIVLIALVFVDGYIGYKIKGERVIENKIAMYQEENTKIEEKIATAITGYMEHESEVFEKASINSETLDFYIAKYPELKSDELVKKQIDEYNDNQNRIIKLKDGLLNIPRLKWLLYFG